MPSSEADGAMKATANRLAVEAEELLRLHEVEEHGGGRCQAERVGFVAFMAHRLGVRDQVSVAQFIKYLIEYEHGHAERQAHREGDHHG